jgi:chromosome segregation ATPase|tara:strand:+ start:178 stop:462 length:285 start_codon:yes stop_codon:yes gene_type:complete
MKKVSTEHLEQIQELNKKQVDIKIALGETQLMQQNVDNRVKELQDSFSEVSKEMQELSNELKEEHGEVQIDVTTGEIVDQPSTNVEKDDDKGDS